MQEIKALQAQPYGASLPFTREFQGRVLGALEFKFGTVITTGAAGLASFFTDPMLKLLGTVEVVQSETSIIRASAQLLYWLGALLDGEPGRYNSPTIGVSTTGLSSASFAIDLQKLIGPLGMIDARFSKLFVRGTFGPVTSVSSTANAVASIAGNLRTSLRTTDRVPRNVQDGLGYLRPNFTQSDMDVSQSSANLQYVHRFEQDTVCPGMVLMTKDDSAGGSAVQVDPQASRVDGLIKSIKVDLQSQDYNGEIIRATWGELVARTWRGTMFSGSAAQPLGIKPTGVVWLPFVDEANPQFNGARLFRRGDALTFTVDTSGTAEEEFTNVPPAANDLLSMLRCDFAPATTSEDATSVGDKQNLRRNALDYAAGGGNLRKRLV